MLLIVRALVPELVRVTALAGLGIARSWVPKNKERDESVTVVADCGVALMSPMAVDCGAVARAVPALPHPDTDNSKTRSTEMPARTRVLFIGLSLF